MRNFFTRSGGVGHATHFYLHRSVAPSLKNDVEQQDHRHHNAEEILFEFITHHPTPVPLHPTIIPL